MHLEEFSSGSSVIHRLDPRVKIIGWTLFSLVTAVAGRFPVLLAALAVSLFLVILAGLKPSRVINRLLIFNVFVLFLWFFLPFSHPGTPVWQLGPLTATREGLLVTLAITIKSNAIILAVIGLLSTSTFSALIHAASHLKMPDKLVQLFFFTFRYFQVIHQEYLRLRAAMKVRCFTPKTNRHTYRSWPTWQACLSPAASTVRNEFTRPCSAAVLTAGSGSWIISP